MIKMLLMVSNKINISLDNFLDTHFYFGIGEFISNLVCKINRMIWIKLSVVEMNRFLAKR